MKLPAADITTRYLIQHEGEWHHIVSVLRWPHGQVIFNLRRINKPIESKTKCHRLDVFEVIPKS